MRSGDTNLPGIRRFGKFSQIISTLRHASDDAGFKQDFTVYFYYQLLRFKHFLVLTVFVVGIFHVTNLNRCPYGRDLDGRIRIKKNENVDNLPENGVLKRCLVVLYSIEDTPEGFVWLWEAGIPVLVDSRPFV